MYGQERDDSRARILVFEEALRAPVMAITDSLAVERLVYVGTKPEGREIRFERFVEPGAEGEPEAPVGWHDPAFIMYTSGTTGRPKGVVRSHLAELMGSMTMALECGFRHDDILLNNKPLYHIAQLQIQLTRRFYGGGPDGYNDYPTLETQLQSS